MKDYYCPNFEGCQLLNTNQVIDDQKQKDIYREEYCINPELTWKNCKRYQTRVALNFCPDFVLPDTKLSPAEIMNKYDEEFI